MLEKVVIVGASAAGLAAAETLRREGFERRLVLVGDETRFPYDRPPLSKQVLSGSWSPDKTTLRAEAHYDDLDIDVRLGRSAVSLDVGSRTVALSGGEELSFDRLIIATGVEPRRLSGGPHPEGVHVLRTLDHALALRSDLESGAQMVVVGAGFLGCEIASVARSRGLGVTLVDPLAWPMMRSLGVEVGQAVAELHRQHGTTLRMGVGIDRILGEGRVSGVRLTDGTAVPADVVVVAVGATPATNWLVNSGLTLEDGVVCDEMCCAAPDIYAAGDIARWYNPRFGVDMRIEHRTNATEQGMAAARNAMGAERVFDPIPFFWSDQYDAKIQAYGYLPPGALPIVTRGQPGGQSFTLQFGHRGRISAAIGWNMPRELRSDRGAIGAELPAASSSAHG